MSARDRDVYTVHRSIPLVWDERVPGMLRPETWRDRWRRRLGRLFRRGRCAVVTAVDSEAGTVTLTSEGRP